MDNYIQFQPQINELARKLSNLGFDFFKQGGDHQPIKENLVGKNENSYIKAYISSAINQGKKELELIHAFNEFSVLYNTKHTGPVLTVVKETQEYIYFIMEDITKSGKISIDFTKKSRGELLILYAEYRKEFDLFEKYMTEKGDIITSNKDNIQKILTKQYDQVFNWIQKGAPFVDILPEDVLYYKATFKSLQDAIRPYPLEYDFGRFWTGHIFSDGYNHQIIDFDNVGYQLKGQELVSIMRSNLFLSCNNYDNYEKRESEFCRRYEYLCEYTIDEILADLLLVHKLIGTIFMDLGYMLHTSEQKQSELLEKNINLENYISTSLEWNYRLLKKVLAKHNF